MPFLNRRMRLEFEAAVNAWAQRPANQFEAAQPDRMDYGWYQDDNDRDAARQRRFARLAREAAEAPVPVPPAPVWPNPVPPLNLDAIVQVAAPRAVRLRRDPDMPNNREYLKSYPELDLTKLPDGPKIIRTVALPPFKVDYDSHEQIHQKLTNSVIMIKDNPFTVVATIEAPKGFALLVRNAKSQTAWVMYSDVQDFRGIAPGYVNYQNMAYWLYRVPERQNRQGMTSNNTMCRRVGTEFISGARADFLLDALSSRKDLEYSPAMGQMLEAGVCTSIRLTNEVALFKSTTKGAPVGVEYLGRTIGLIVRDQVKVFDENDLTPSWINKDFMATGLQLTA